MQIEIAPTSTKFGAAWYCLDTGGVAACNSANDASTTKADGSRDLDFSLPATGSGPSEPIKFKLS